MNASIRASVKLLKEKDIRPSVQRIRVLEYLQKSDNHPTVDNIYNYLVKEIPTLSKTTVYNILKLFSEKNVTSTVRIGINEARYDADTSVHGHFKCEKCGNIYDFNVNIEELKLTGLDKFKINEHHIYLKGICKNCNTEYEEFGRSKR